MTTSARKDLRSVKHEKNASVSSDWSAELMQHQRHLWHLAYRLSGCAADADEVVQETFARAIERPPARLDEPLRPWLVRVAMNIGRDVLRRRKRAPYVGPWLPSPIETGDEYSPGSYEIGEASGASTEWRYDMLESVSFAFLIALEALTPLQRAVLILRDVFEYSVIECAAALEISEPNVKTTHHRARRAMDSYDRNRCVPTRELQERTRAALEQFMGAIAVHDVESVEAALAKSVRAVSDGGGEFFAARVPIDGPSKVTRFFLNVSKYYPATVRFEIRMFNGLPALITMLDETKPNLAKLVFTRCDIDEKGRVSAVHAILASRKLTEVREP